MRRIPKGRQSIAAVALIRCPDESRALWLAQWNRRWRKYNFVAGHKRPEETFRECLLREMSEELHLREGVDYNVPEQPVAHREYDAWSESAQAETHYVLELFDVTLIGDSALQTVNADPNNRWLTETEIRARHCTDGMPVSATMGMLLIGTTRRAGRGGS